MERIHSGYTLESVGGRNSQDVVNFVLRFFETGVSDRRTIRSDSVNIYADDPGTLRKSEARFILLRTLS